ncbi:DUF2399 domain-containing protein [Longimicrobium sp.]|uniref:DUF2399 domain-containing protein n=1 Tax=Longimicrobium sp. TaxID=2029185 RepID=UPI002E2F154E|nr:DUF2399 domain-containing protein [Longimicrobium sp.]HEX6041915.1 DUF2399 domain-containing protein [Longimicrobium sp.]
MNPDLERDLLMMLRSPHMARLLEVFRERLVRHGEPKGRVTIETRLEADALADIIGKQVKEGGSIGLAEVDLLLREKSAFHCSLVDAIKLASGKPIIRPKVERERERAARERAVSRCFALLPELSLSPESYARVVSWMQAGRDGLRRDAGRWGEAELLAAVRAVALALHHAPSRHEPPVYLAELANRVTGAGAHGLDAKRPAGTLLLRALEFFFPDTARRERRGSSAWRTNLLSEARIARDPVSIRVDTFGLMGDMPYLRELRRAALTRSLNLDDLAQIGQQVRCWNGCVFVAENPTVFALLFRHLREKHREENHATLVCTNGNLNLADWTLLESLIGSGAHVYYCGDFDVRGLEIAAALLTRFPEAVSPWRMTADDYISAIQAGKNKLDPTGLQRVNRHFPELVREMSKRGLAADQESSLIEMLKRDLNRFVLEGIAPPRWNEPPGHSSRRHTAQV